jgi:hypothetical protein
MNIKERLNQEHSKACTQSIVDYIDGDKKKFKSLMDLFLGDDKRIAQRAAWVFGNVASDCPKLINEYFSKLIAQIKTPDIHDAIPRNITKVFQFAHIPEKHEAELLDVCFDFIKSETVSIAVRVYSISIANRICKKYPELQGEFLLILNEMMLHPQSPAVNVRLKLALKDLKSVKS